MSQGTRSHQLAMYVVYESPLQMISDSPTKYDKNLRSFEFIKSIPTTWDETALWREKWANISLLHAGMTIHGISE